jgi:hypothetical protein
MWKRLGFLVFVTAFVALFYTSGVYAIEKPYDGEVYIEYNNGEIEYDFFIEKKDEYKLYLSLKNSDVEGGCIRERDGEKHLTHYMPEECKFAEFKTYRGLESAVQNDSGFGLVENDSFLARNAEERSPYGIWWYNEAYSNISSEQSTENGWNNEGLDSLNVQYSSEITVVGHYILGGDRWNKETIQVLNEDLASVHYMDGSGSMLSILRNISIPSDKDSEIVNTVIINNSGKNYSGHIGAGGLYTSGSNSILINGANRSGAMIHEYSHSQQDYNTSNDMRWLIEGGATYDANLELSRLGIRTDMSKWSSFTVKEDEKKARTVLAKPETWRQITPYSKGQSILVLTDMCLNENTDADIGIKKVQEDIRSEGGKVTFNRFSSEVANYVEADKEDIKRWLYEYIFGPYSPSNEKIFGEDRTCWDNADTPPSLSQPIQAKFSHK